MKRLVSPASLDPNAIGEGVIYVEALADPDEDTRILLVVRPYYTTWLVEVVRLDRVKGVYDRAYTTVRLLPSIHDTWRADVESMTFRITERLEEASRCLAVAASLMDALNDYQTATSWAYRRYAYGAVPAEEVNS